MCCVPAQAVEDANGDAGSAEEPQALVREHNLYVKHFEPSLDSAGLRAMFEARTQEHACHVEACAVLVRMDTLPQALLASQVCAVEDS